MLFLNFPKLYQKLRYFPNCKGPGPIPNELEKNSDILYSLHV